MKLAESIEKYKVYELRGRGGFAEVYRAVELETGMEVAIKKISKESVSERKMWDRVKQELAIHSVLEHPAIVKVYTCFQDSTYLYLVMEFCPNGELRKLLEERNAPFNENQTRSVLKQVLSGLKYLHSHRIIHRDITLSNLLLTREWNVKIADFGLAVKFSQPDEKHKTMCGTPNYIAPEVVTRKDQGPETDIWNVGIMMYTLLVGKPPFDTEHEHGGVKITLQKVVTEEITWPSYLSSEVVNLMDSMLKKASSERITLSGIFSHPFMIQGTCEDLRMLTPISADRYDDSGFMTTTTPSWLTAGGSSSCNFISHKFIPSAISSRGQFSPFLVHSSCCRDSKMGSCSQPHRPPHHSSTHDQSSIACSYSSNLCMQCSHVENCSCCLAGRLSMTGFSNHRNSMHDNNGSCISVKSHNRNDSRNSNGPSGAPMKKAPGGYQENIRILPPDLSVPPINTVRLKPKLRVKGKAVYFSIIKTGDVCLEFFKENQKKFVEVMLISSDGLRISFLSPYDEHSAEPGIGQTLASYSYEVLPDKYLKKYLYALKCVNNERAVTSKIIYYSPLGKCHLMENGPDPNFTIHFYSGGKIVKKGSEVEILDNDYNVISKHPLNSKGHDLEPRLKILWEHFKMCLNECLIKEEDLEELSSRRPGIIWFPNTSGQKAQIGEFTNNQFNLAESSKENFPMPPNSRRASASAPSSLVERSSSSLSSSKNKILKKVFDPSIGTAIQMSNGLMCVHYVDKTKLEVVPSSSSRKSTLFTFVNANGLMENYKVDADVNSFRIPSEVREKISLYGVMVEKLKDA